MAKPATKPYRLIRGTHSFPNPDYTEGVDDPVESHKVAKVNDIVELNAEQYKSFKDKFRPITTEGTDIRDAEDNAFEQAKARAALTGENQNPNVPAPATPTPGDKFAAARPTPQ